MIPRRSPHNFRNYFSSRSFKNSYVESEDLTQEDIIIVVMGPSGSGKSTFIETITGFPGIVGHGLQSFTSKISVYKISFPDLADSDIHFVDTPGFDDTTMSDVDIFKTISDWLHNTYRRKIRVTGLLYLYRISDNHMEGTTLKNLNLFESLCGPEFNKIVLTTTMWDEVDEWTGNSREEELQDTYWKPMIVRGSSVRRFLRTRPSAFEVLEPILGDMTRQKATLLQREVEDLGLNVNQTRTGWTLCMQLEEHVDQVEEILNRIRSKLKTASLTTEELALLMEDYRNRSLQMQRTANNAMRLTKSVPPANWKEAFRNLFTTKKLPDKTTNLYSSWSPQDWDKVPASSSKLPEDRHSSPSLSSRQSQSPCHPDVSYDVLPNQDLPQSHPILRLDGTTISSSSSRPSTPRTDEPDNRLVESGNSKKRTRPTLEIVSP